MFRLSECRRWSRKRLIFFTSFSSLFSLAHLTRHTQHATPENFPKLVGVLSSHIRHRHGLNSTISLPWFWLSHSHRDDFIGSAVSCVCEWEIFNSHREANINLLDWNGENTHTHNLFRRWLHSNFNAEYVELSKKKKTNEVNGSSSASDFY